MATHPVSRKGPVDRTPPTGRLTVTGRMVKTPLMDSYGDVGLRLHLPPCCRIATERLARSSLATTLRQVEAFRLLKSSAQRGLPGRPSRWDAAASCATRDLCCRQTANYAKVL